MIHDADHQEHWQLGQILETQEYPYKQDQIRAVKLKTLHEEVM